MLEGPKFAGLIDLNQNHDNYGLSQNFYHKLGEGSNMSIDSYPSLQMSNGGGSVAMSMDNSSVGSNDSNTRILNHQGLKRVHNNYSVAASVNRGKVSHGLSDDALAQALMDPQYATQGLENYDEWTIDLRKLNMGPAFAQGAFGKLYKGTYKAGSRSHSHPKKIPHNPSQITATPLHIANLHSPNTLIDAATSEVHPRSVARHPVRRPSAAVGHRYRSRTLEVSSFASSQCTDF